MGLITKEVEVKLNSRNIKYYEELGYKTPKMKGKRSGTIVTPMGTKITVKVEDLTNGSNIKIDVQCDNCKKIINIYWQGYKKCSKEDGKYYCKQCAKKLYGGENTRSTNLKNGTSFEQWCINNNRQDILDRWDYELNNCKPSEISFSRTKKHWFKCPRKIHESESKSISHFTNGQEGSMYCKKCNSFAQWGIDNLRENFLEKYWDYNKNISNPWEISKGSNAPKIWIKCQEKDYHKSYDVSCNSFTHMNSKCPHCCNYHGKVHKFDSLGTLFPYVFEIWSDKNEKSPYEYSPNSKQKVWWKCPEGKHEDYKRQIYSSNKYSFRCHKCIEERDESLLQEKIRLYLNSLGYILLHEYDCILKCINPKTKHPLPYDNEIIDLKLIVEVHGGQHYLESSGKWFDKNYDLCKRQLYDRYKRMYAKSQGYNYLEIPYWTDNKNETWKQLINDKIESIVDIKIAI